MVKKIILIGLGVMGLALLAVFVDIAFWRLTPRDTSTVVEPVTLPAPTGTEPSAVPLSQ